MRMTRAGLAFLLVAMIPLPVAALVSYDQGQMTINGVQLLQDYNDPTLYYYLPQYPRLATKRDGTFELLCMKYVDEAGGTNGGLFHALVEFSLPEDVVENLEEELRKKVAEASIAGAVPLMQTVEDGEAGMGSFRVVSALLSDTEEGGFARSVITSGKAPVMPGSKAVVAALLNQHGATLLWESLMGPTSDVSVAIHAYYEAAVRGYNARVTAEMETVYKHFSTISNYQKKYTRRQIRDIVDELKRDGILNVEVLDRSKGLGIDTSAMDGILQVVTDKLTELMFDTQNGWAKDPPREVAVEANQIKGRQDRGWFARTFLGADDTEYYSDNQYVIKKREEIRTNTFSLNLAQDTTIRVPVDTAGNIGGFYDEMSEDPRYFRVVNLDDPAFEFRTVHFQIDGEYLDSFQDTVNFVSVNFRKTYDDRPAFTRKLHFSGADVKAGKTIQEVSFPRLGDTEKDWVEYEYQVRWSLRDRPTVSVPKKEDKWIATSDAAISLVPPFEKRVLEIEADRGLFSQRGMSTAVVELATKLAGQRWQERTVVLRSTDADSVNRVSVYMDRGTRPAMAVSWHSPDKKVQEKAVLVESDYLYLVPPPPGSKKEGETSE
jgi:hypothetical protein